MQGIGFMILRNMRAAGAIVPHEMGSQLRTRRTSCDESGSGTLRTVRSVGSILSDTIISKLTTNRSSCEGSGCRTLRNIRSTVQISSPQLKLKGHHAGHRFLEPEEIQSMKNNYKEINADANELDEINDLQFLIE